MAQKKAMSFRFDEYMFTEIRKFMFMLGLDPDSLTKTSMVETVVDVMASLVFDDSNIDNNWLRYKFYRAGVEKVIGTPTPKFGIFEWDIDDGYRCMEDNGVAEE